MMISLFFDVLVNVLFIGLIVYFVRKTFKKKTKSNIINKRPKDISENFCTSCEREVGPIIKRGQVKSFIFLAFLSLAGLVVAQMYFGPSFAEKHLAQAYGAQITSGSVNDWWLLIPLVLLLIGIKNYFDITKKCPVCNLEM